MKDKIRGINVGGVDINEFIIEFYNKVNWKTLDIYNKINKEIFRKMNRECKLHMLMNYREIWEKYNGR